VDPYEEFIRWYEAKRQSTADPLTEYNPVIWPELAREEFELDWLVEGFWPAGKHMHLFAAHKTGKSLVSLHMAANIAMGRDPFTGMAMPAHDVSYVDNEMTRQDLQERLFDMGFAPDMESGALDRLHYHFYPHIGALDTPEGAQRLMEWVQKDGSDAVVLDTISRVVRGEENSNDTYRNFYNYTGTLLKAHGIALLRLDHEGHIQGHSRGASSKADDVDIVYRLKAAENGLVLDLQVSRVNYVRQTITLTKGTDLLTFTAVDHYMWPAGTTAKADELDAMGCPEGLSVRKTQKWLRDNGQIPGNTQLLTAAIKWRNGRVTMPGID